MPANANAHHRLPRKFKSNGSATYTVLYRDLNDAGKMHNTSFSFYGHADDPKSHVQGLADADQLIALLNTPALSVKAAFAAHPAVAGEVTSRPTRGPLFRDYALECLATNPNDAQADTVAKDRIYVRSDMVGYWGADKRIADITPADINGFVKYLKTVPKRKNGPSTISKKLNVLSRVLRQATKDGVIPVNPMLDDAIRRPKKEEVEKTGLNEDEFIVIRDAIHFEGYKILFEFLVMTGVRFSEATALQPGDFNITDGYLKIRRAWKHGKFDGDDKPATYQLGDPKTPKAKRTVQVPPTVMDRLMVAGMLKPDREWVFLNTFGGPIRQHTFSNNVWGKTRKRINLGVGRQTVKIKDMRDAYVSWQLADGTPTKLVSDNVGHKHTSTTTGIYELVDRRGAAAAAARHAKRIYK